jgi:hypothetical protein
MVALIVMTVAGHASATNLSSLFNDAAGKL